MACPMKMGEAFRAVNSSYSPGALVVGDVKSPSRDLAREAILSLCRTRHVFDTCALLVSNGGTVSSVIVDDELTMYCGLYR